MSDVLQDMAPLGNYHGTLAPATIPHACIRFPRQPDGATHFRRSAEAVQSVIAAGPSRPLVARGAGWSFSRLLETGGTLLDLSAVAQLYELAATDLAASGEAQAKAAVLAGGACTLKQVNGFIEPKGRSLATSGSHNGPTVAGAIATGTHGGALGEGGFQNQARGCHLVAGAGPARWIAGDKAWLPSAAFLKRLGCAATVDPALFAALQSHLGGLGILNAVLLETRPRRMFRRTTRQRHIGRDLMNAMAKGRFDDVAASLQLPSGPTYLEVTLDPRRPFDRAAFLTLYHAVPGLVAADDPAPRDRLNLFAEIPGLDGNSRLIIPFDLWQAYALVFGDAEDFGSWGQFHAKHNQVTRGWHSSAFAVPRERLGDAVAAMAASVAALGTHFLFTIRFVSCAAGTLTFCRFPETAVINIDGIPAALSDEPARATRRCQAALADAGILHGLHWGKLGDLDAAKVRADYGDPADSRSPRAAWDRARAALVEPTNPDLFGNGALRAWGLV
jgi:FAD/FMN-containing dehydrogenase